MFYEFAFFFSNYCCFFFIFFFQAEDGIRDDLVTGVKTCALPIYRVPVEERYRYVVYPWIFSPEFLAKKENVEQAVQRALAYPHQTKPEAIERQARGVLAWNGTRVKRLGSIRVPALVLVGKDDILTPPAFSTFLATKLPRARRVVLPGGHGFFLEQADAFNRAVLRFLKSVRSR